MKKLLENGSNCAQPCPTGPFARQGGWGLYRYWKILFSDRPLWPFAFIEDDLICTILEARKRCLDPTSSAKFSSLRCLS